MNASIWHKTNLPKKFCRLGGDVDTIESGGSLHWTCVMCVFIYARVTTTKKLLIAEKMLLS